MLFYSYIPSYRRKYKIKYNHLLKEIKKVNEDPNDIFYFEHTYNSSLKLKLEILKDKFNISSLNIKLDEINLILSKYIKFVNCLILKNEFINYYHKQWKNVFSKWVTMI